MAHSQILTTILVLAFLGFASAKNRVNVNRQNYVSKNTTQENIVPSTVQGTIFCVSYDGNDWTPMKGAYARVSCLRFLVESTMTNENGYYTISLPAKRYSDCKVFLDRPGDGNNCSVPTNTNQGLAGAPLINPVRQPGQIADVYCPLFETTSTTTDENGFFIVELPANRFDNDCRVYLDTFGHGEEDCIYRTNVNEGISGARIVKSDENGIYQVGPFVYRTTPAEV